MHPQPFHELSELPMAELEACVEACLSTPASSIFSDPRKAPENTWVTFEADVRSAAAAAAERLRAQQAERCAEVLRLCEHEEQTRCQAFQAAMMGEISPSVYQATVRSILEKLLAKLETFAPEPSLYQAAAQCLSEYMSALNHHCDICAVPRSPAPLPAIAEDDLCQLDSSDYPSELGSEDAETLSVYSETVSEHGSLASRLSGGPRLSGGADDLALGFGRPHAASAPAIIPPTAMGAGAAAMASGAALGAASGASVGCLPSAGSSLGGASCSGTFSDEIRKERRREANKKASVKYRSKKATSMQQVLADCSASRQQVVALASQNAVLTAENQLLKQQVEFLQGMLQKAGASAGHTLTGARPAAPPPAVVRAPPPIPTPSAVPPPSAFAPAAAFTAPAGPAAVFTPSTTWTNPTPMSTDGADAASAAPIPLPQDGPNAWF
jgi:hypothetical protein